MLQLKKKWHRPTFKHFAKLRQNVQNRSKVFNFKSKKWFFLKNYLIRQNKFFRKNKIHDHIKFKIPKFASHGTSMKKKFKNSMQAGQRFSLFYGKFSKKYLKKKFKSILKKKAIKHLTNPNRHILGNFESRLDSVLYRSHFTISVRNSQQLILHGHILINGTTEKRKDYIVKIGDHIKIKPESQELIINNIKQTNFWPIPPKYLYINYKTLEIIFGNVEDSNFYYGFPFWLDLPSVIYYYKRH